VEVESVRHAYDRTEYAFTESETWEEKILALKQNTYRLSHFGIKPSIEDPTTTSMANFWALEMN
jgi:hypothetical protein